MWRSCTRSWTDRAERRGRPGTDRGGEPALRGGGDGRRRDHEAARRQGGVAAAGGQEAAAAEAVAAVDVVERTRSGGTVPHARGHRSPVAFGRRGGTKGRPASRGVGP